LQARVVALRHPRSELNAKGAQKDAEQVAHLHALVSAAWEIAVGDRSGIVDIGSCWTLHQIAGHLELGAPLAATTSIITGDCAKAVRGARPWASQPPERRAWRACGCNDLDQALLERRQLQPMVVRHISGELLSNETSE
jgi:hypothetical protein